MATKKRKRSALKRIRQTQRRTTVKTIGRSAARTAVRTAREAIAKGGEAAADVIAAAAGALDELGCELRRLQQEARCRGEVLHQVPRVARAERDVALAAVRRDPIRGLRVESDLLLLADAAQDLGEFLVRGRLDLDLVLDAPQERLVDEG